MLGQSLEFTVGVEDEGRVGLEEWQAHLFDAEVDLGRRFSVVDSTEPAPASAVKGFGFVDFDKTERIPVEGPRHVLLACRHGQLHMMMSHDVSLSEKSIGVGGRNPVSVGSDSLDVQRKE